MILRLEAEGKCLVSGKKNQKDFETCNKETESSIKDASIIQDRCRVQLGLAEITCTKKTEIMLSILQNSSSDLQVVRTEVKRLRGRGCVEQRGRDILQRKSSWQTFHETEKDWNNSKMWYTEEMQFKFRMKFPLAKADDCMFFFPWWNEWDVKHNGQKCQYFISAKA